MAQRIVFKAKQHVELEDFEPEALGPEQVRVRSLCSLMSTGTEGIVYNRLFEPGTHWDHWVKYPFHVGYATVGEVTEVGPGVESLSVGQRIVARKPHASEMVVDADGAYPVPEAVASEDAAWFALGKIAFHGAQTAGFCLGQKVAIVGAGPLGQMASRWAHAGGVDRLIVIDTAESRLEMAKAGGATDVIAKPVGEAKDAVWDLCGGEGPDVVLDVTGHPQVLSPALSLPRRHGKLVVLGDTGTPSEQRLTNDVVARGIQIVGAHDGHNTTTWSNATIVPLFLRMLATGRISVAGLITHTFSPTDVVDAFELTRHRRQETMGVLFDWTRVGAAKARGAQTARA